MRIRVSRADMLEQAQRTGYLSGKSLRKGPGTHHDEWWQFCAANDIAFVSLSIGRHHAAVEIDLRTIRPEIAFRDIPPLSYEILSAVNRVWECEPSHRITQRDDTQTLEVRGISTIAGEWLAGQFADIAGRHHRELADLPSNVFNIQEYRRKRARRDIA